LSPLAAALVTEEFPATAFRVGRRSGVIHFAEIDAVDAANIEQGGRFDVVGGGVLYCATTKTGAYKEVLAAFRPSAKAYRIADGESIMAQGSMPRSWRDARALAEFSLEDPLPFVDIERDSTLTHLTAAMAEQLDELDVRALDVSLVRGSNRLLTRSIAKWVYTRVDEEGVPLFGGIRYLSRFQSHECWAVFNGSIIGTVRTEPILLSDTELTNVSREFGITLH
jgi:hypothetical protein